MQFTCDCIPLNENLRFLIKQILKIGIISLSSNDIASLEAKYTNEVLGGYELERYLKNLKVQGKQAAPTSHPYPPPGEQAELQKAMKAIYLALMRNAEGLSGIQQAEKAIVILSTLRDEAKAEDMGEQLDC